MPSRPNVFVASSYEARRVAIAVQQNLKDYANVLPWQLDALGIGRNIIDEIYRNLMASDFGVFVFSPDDRLEIHGQTQGAVRDNVVLELGMFIGRLGKERSFIIKPKGEQIRLPSDLAGVIAGEYDIGDNLRAALAGVCDEIAQAMASHKNKRDPLVDEAVENALETVCRAMSVPMTPEQASLRAFIFRKEDSQLVCTHFYDPNPSEEQVGMRFPIDARTAERVQVVRCILDAEAFRGVKAATEIEAQGGTVEPLPKEFAPAAGDVKQTLKYVLAAPIFDEDGAIWGVVDFDSSNETGNGQLKTKVAKSVLLRLAQHLTCHVADLRY